MTDTGYHPINRAGYTQHDGGYSGSFSWFRNSLFPGKWLVACHEADFTSRVTCTAVTDDFGNLVRVPA